jgi:hypothetical protein
MQTASSQTNSMIESDSKNLLIKCFAKAITRIDKEMEFVQYLPTIKWYNPYYYGSHLIPNKCQL